LTAEVEAIAYEPGTQEVILTDKNGRRAINTWVPGNVHIAELPPLRLPHPTPPEEYLRRAREQLNEAAQPWLDFLSHLFPIEAEREFVMRWCATLVVRPEIKMNFGLLLISEVQGVGKTTLGMILSVLIGEHNVSWPNENQILENQFNTWRVRKRLVFCNEIYSGHSLRAYNKLKDVISDAYFEAREMYTPSYTLKSYVHVILCSNSIDALRLAEDDRRVYMPKVTDQKWPEKRWVALHTWLVEGGYGVVLLWAREFLKSHDAIGPETHPPMTETKRKTIEGQTDEDQRLARDIAEAALEMAQAKGRERVILLDRMVQEWVAGKLGLRIDTDDPRGRAAWHWSFKKVRKGLTQAGLKLVSQYKQVGTRYEAYGNFGAEEYDPKTFHEEVVAPRDVELWDDQRRPL
jgi:hypothetical protein